MDWRAIFDLILIVGMVLIGSYSYFSLSNKTIDVSCPECKTCPECKESLFKDNFEYCKGKLNTETNLAEDLWDDYWACYLVYACTEDFEWCKENWQTTQENLTYAEHKCALAEKYNNYYERWES